MIVRSMGERQAKIETSSNGMCANLEKTGVNGKEKAETNKRKGRGMGESRVEAKKNGQKGYACETKKKRK